MLEGECLFDVVHLAPQEKDIPFSRDGDAVRFKVEKLECHQMVALEYEK